MFLHSEQARFRRWRRSATDQLPSRPDGKFTDEGPEYCRGRWVKDCDKDIIRDLKQRGLLFHQEQYLHDYPFCWRAEEDPLIQYPRESWFIRTTAVQGRRCWPTTPQINWLPEHIKDGRFGNFLESNVDWALSRERYWGTPLPIWVCEQTGQDGSRRQLRRTAGQAGRHAAPKSGTQPKQRIPSCRTTCKFTSRTSTRSTYDSPFAKGATMRRVTEVIDCWFDSGAMPFAQWGYPHTAGSAEQFRSAVPRRLHQRSHRPDPRLVLQPAGDQHAAVWRRARREESSEPRLRLDPRPSPLTPTPIPSATASSSA